MIGLRIILYVGLVILFIDTRLVQATTIDSLKNLYSLAKHDTTKCRLLNVLIENEYDDAIWPLYNQDLLQLSQQHKNEANPELRAFYGSYQALALNNFGYYYSYIKNDFIKAHDYYQRALAIEKTFDNKEGIATVYTNLGYTNRIEGNYPLALDYYHQALKIQLQIENKAGAAIAYNNIAYVFNIQKEYLKAFDYYKKALQLHESTNDQEGIAICYGNLAHIYTMVGDVECDSLKFNCKKKGYEKAIDLLEKAIQLLEHEANIALLANSMNHLAGLLDEIGDPRCRLDSLTCNTQNEKKVWSLYKQALDIRLAINDTYGLSQSYASISKHYFNRNKNDSALYYGQLGLRYSKESQSPERIMDIAKILKAVYKNKGDYKNGFEMLELFIAMRDSLYNEESNKSILRKTFQIDYEIATAKDSLEHLSIINQQKIENELRIKKQQYYTYGGFIAFVLMLVIALVSFRAYRLKQKSNAIITEQKNQVEEKNKVIEKQKEEVEEKQKEILQSITYAKRIQEAILPPDHFIKNYLDHYFILYQPKDIVAGDFYWAEYADNTFYLAAADSTGHGVPGALVSVVCSGALNRSVKEFNLRDTGKILDKTRELVIETFEKSTTDVKDGMDISLLRLDKTNQTIQWSGANNSLWIIRDKNLIEIKADKQAIGKTENATAFQSHEYNFKDGDMFYLFTDGYADQFGGESGKKLKSKNFQNLLLSICDKSM